MTNVVPLNAPDPSSVDAVISENTTLLLHRAGDQKQSLALALGIEPSSLSHKLKNRRPWTATEIDAIARRYRVSHSALFTKLPHLDSNQEPIVSRFDIARRFAEDAPERHEVAIVTRMFGRAASAKVGA